MHAKLRAIGTKLLGGTPRTNKRFPIAILSFNRPHYLREVLLSLRPQVDEDDRITLFQDGAWNPYSKQRRTHPAHIAVCVGLFREIIPWGTVAESKYNIGVAENYERAEQQIFRRWREPCGLFLEDDMVLSPNYLAVTKMLLDIAQKEPRISYVSAYGDLRASVAEQEARPRDLIPMHENWGFAITRRAWLDERPFRRKYLRLIRGRDYTRLDENAVRQFFGKRGWGNTFATQDAARWIASVDLGKVRVTTFPCHARNIGKVGLHFSKESYEQRKLGASVFFPGPPCEPLPPSEEQMKAWLEEERRRFAIG